MNKLFFVLVIALFPNLANAQFVNDTILVGNDIVLLKISNHAYVHTSYIQSVKYGRMGANGLLLVNEHEAMLFDTPWNDSLTEVLYNFIVDSLGARITAFVPNHWHEDCMGGLAFLQKKGVKSYANKLTINIAKNEHLPVPEIAFTDSLDIFLGKMAIKLYFIGAAHSLDNIVVWVQTEQILFAGCTVKGMYARNLGNTADGDLIAYPLTIKKILNQFNHAKIVIPGHGAYGGIELLEHTLDLANKQK